ARVVADALPDFRPSASTGHALTDPAADHRYGAIGFEIEFNQVLDKDRAFDLAYGRVLATHVLGAQIEVDHMNVFRAGEELYFTPEEASRHTRRLKVEEHWVAEFVSPPGRVLDSESWEQDLPSILSTAAKTRSMLANAPAGATLQQILSEDPGWIVSNEYAGVAVHPAPLGAVRDAAYTQFTVGVPAGGLLRLLHLVEGREHAPHRRRLLSASRIFGKSLAEEYVRSTGKIRLRTGEIELLSQDPLVREVWGYGWLLFSQAAAFPYGQKKFPKKITKNMTSAALRNPIGLVRSTLSQSVQEFLHKNHTAIRQDFAMALWSLLENRSAAGVPASELAKALYLELSDDIFVVDYLDYGLSRSAARAVSQRDALGMNDYPDLDVISGVPSMLLELRNIGSRHGRMTQDDLRHYSAELFDMVRSFSDAHDSDQADRNDLGDMVERLHARPEVVQAARLLAFLPELREIQDKPIQELANSSHVPFLARSLGELALRGTALPPEAAKHLLSLATTLRDALAQGRLSPDLLGGHAPERLNEALTATLTVTAQHSARQGGHRAETSRSATVTSAAPRSGAASTAATSSTRGPYAHAHSDAQAERVAYPEPSAAAWNKWLPTIEWARSQLDQQAETYRSSLLQDARKIVARHHIAPAADRARHTRQTNADRYRQVHADVVNVVAGYLHQERLGSKPQGRAAQISRQLADELGTRPAGNSGGRGDVQVFMAATDHTVDKGLEEVLTDVLATGGPADLERLGRAIGTRRVGREPNAPGEADWAERGATPSRLHEESNSPTRPPEVDAPERAEQGSGPVARPAGGRPPAADAATEDLPDPHVLRARTAGAAGEPGRRQASPPRPIRFRERVALAVREWDKPLPEAVEDLEQLLRDAGQGARSLVLRGEPRTVLWAVNVGGEIQWKDRSLMPAQAPRSASGPVRSIDLTPSSELISPPQELLDAGDGATRFCQISPGAKLRGVM
ncbi:hypothetical protein, partial [Streptomyces zhihengii]|uniref:hypothetical protein n=1 Tax=Streptomyces zhihengii TaxID=1818004 RepID=UPI0033B6B3FB